MYLCFFFPPLSRILLRLPVVSNPIVVKKKFIRRGNETFVTEWNFFFFSRRKKKKKLFFSQFSSILKLTYSLLRFLIHFFASIKDHWMSFFMDFYSFLFASVENIRKFLLRKRPYRTKDQLRLRVQEKRKKKIVWNANY